MKYFKDIIMYVISSLEWLRFFLTKQIIRKKKTLLIKTNFCAGFYTEKTPLKKRSNPIFLNINK